MANFITGIISVSIGAVVLASVFITQVKNTSTTFPCVHNTSQTCSWSASEIALWGLISLIAIAGMIYGVMNIFGLG